jgi:hypothetical protein
MVEILILSNSYIGGRMVSTRLFYLVYWYLKIVLLDPFYREKVGIGILCAHEAWP